MKNTTATRTGFLFLAVLLAVSLAACSSGTKPEPSEPEITPEPTATPYTFEKEAAAYSDAAEKYYTNSDYAGAYKLLEQFQDTEYAPIRELLGTLLYNGQGTAPDQSKALEHLTFAAEKDDALACYMLGEIYRTNTVIGISDSSTTWYQKALPLLDSAYAQNLNAPSAGRIVRAMALMYANGYGTSADPDRAEKMITAFAAADGSNVLQAYRMVCDLGELGLGLNDSLLKHLYGEIQSLAGQGNTEAMRDRANYYYFGEGEIEQNYPSAIEWLTKAADAGDPVAQNDLAAMYRDGIGTDKNPDIAVQLYQQAADQGYAAAQYNLATMYISGTDVEQNLPKAASLLESAANLSFIPAQNRLGLLYFEEPMLEQNYDKAVQWFQKAASVGNVYAEYNLGRCYLDGLGVEQSNELALEWLQKAQAQGHSGADDLLRQNSLA